MSDQFNTGQRTIAETPVSRRSWFTRRRIIVIAVVGTGVVVLLGWLIITPNTPKEDVTKLPKSVSHITYDDPPKAVPVVVATPLKPPEANQAIIQPFVQATPPTIVAQAPTTPVPPPRRPAVYTFGGAGNVPEYMKPKAVGANSGETQHKNIIDTFPKTATIEDQTMILDMDPFICSLDTAINTDVAGPFKCRLPLDVLSATGVTLMEKGTKVWGRYNSSVTQGQKRIVSVTGKAKTPNGVIIPLTGGSMADELGASGVPGDVDNHWGERIGPAVALSLLDSAFSLAQTELQKAGSTNLNISSGSGIGSLAQQMLTHSINIPPTITLPQGTLVALWPPDFINFNPSYKLELAR